jgi:adenine-specific DNA-methyltransferase
MTTQIPDPLARLLLTLLPEHGAAVGNGSLFEQLKKVARKAGISCREPLFDAARESLVAAGLVLKGKGRGGATRRALGVADVAEERSPGFTLESQVVPAELPLDANKSATARPTARRSAPAAPGDPQVLSYRHADRRVNNPEVGLVWKESDPNQPKTQWAYDPHLDPVLQWTGKTERTSFVVDTVSLHVHERVDPMSILADLTAEPEMIKAFRRTRESGISS